MKRICVAAEYGASGISDYDTMEDLSHDHLGLPPDLRQKLDDWISMLDDYCGGGWGVPEFEAEGRRVAVALKDFVGDTYEVYYLESVNPNDELVHLIRADGKTEVVDKNPGRGDLDS